MFGAETDLVDAHGGQGAGKIAAALRGQILVTLAGCPVRGID